MTEIKVYQNVRNRHKFIEVHEDGHYHRAIRQFIYNPHYGHVQLVGDGMLHRCSAHWFSELMQDYTLYGQGSYYGERFKEWFSRKTHNDRLYLLRQIRRANSKQTA